MSLAGGVWQAGERKTAAIIGGRFNCFGGDAGELNSRSSKVQLRIILQAFPPIGILPVATVVIPMRTGQPINLSLGLSAYSSGIPALQRFFTAPPGREP